MGPLAIDHVYVG